mmetsp:Transcript_10538/g.64666  ORF Transcript_10538/g.64666 Transcript_10538/m.64666 type:complete len:250 (-) Transcript_10538:742-1491(-)
MPTSGTPSCGSMDSPLPIPSKMSSSSLVSFSACFVGCRGPCIDGCFLECSWIEGTASVLVAFVGCARAAGMDPSSTWDLNRDVRRSCAALVRSVAAVAGASAAIGDVSCVASALARAGIGEVGARCRLVSEFARADRSRSHGGRLVLAHASRSPVAFFNRSFTSSCASALPRLDTNASRALVALRSRASTCPSASARAWDASRVASSFASHPRPRASASRARRSCWKSSPNVRDPSTTAPSRRSRARSR